MSLLHSVCETREKALEGALKAALETNRHLVDLLAARVDPEGYTAVSAVEAKKDGRITEFTPRRTQNDERMKHRIIPAKLPSFANMMIGQGHFDSTAFRAEQEAGRMREDGAFEPTIEGVPKPIPTP